MKYEGATSTLIIRIVRILEFKEIGLTLKYMAMHLLHSRIILKTRLMIITIIILQKGVPQKQLNARLVLGDRLQECPA